MLARLQFGLFYFSSEWIVIHFMWPVNIKNGFTVCPLSQWKYFFAMAYWPHCPGMIHSLCDSFWMLVTDLRPSVTLMSMMCVRWQSTVFVFLASFSVATLVNTEIVITVRRNLLSSVDVGCSWLSTWGCISYQRILLLVIIFDDSFAQRNFCLDSFWYVDVIQC